MKKPSQKLINRLVYDEIKRGFSIVSYDMINDKELLIYLYSDDMKKSINIAFHVNGKFFQRYSEVECYCRI